MTLGDDKRAVTGTDGDLLGDGTGFFGSHDAFEGILLDVADDPFLAGTVAGGYIAQGIDEKEVLEGAARGAVAGVIAAEAAMDAAIEISAAVVLEFVLDAAAPGGEEGGNELFVL